MAKTSLRLLINWNYFNMRFLLLVSLFIFSILGCNLARKCAEHYPCIESPAIVTSDTLTVTDTLEFGDILIYLDTTVCPPATEPTTIVKTVEKLVPGKTITNTIFITKDSLVKVKDSAAIQLAIDSVTAVWKVRLAEAKNNSLEGKLWLLILGLIALGTIYLLSKKIL